MPSNIAYIPLDDDILMVVDLEDVPMLLDYSWDDRQGRPRGYRKKKVVQASHLLTRPPEGMWVDHINRDPLDNRKVNLRICTPKENARNRPAHRDGKTGWKGVSWRKDRAKWRVNCLRREVGHFNCILDAATAYNFAAAELHGEFAVFNAVPQPWLEEP